MQNDKNYILTIAIPTYNRQAYLSDCLESIYAQFQFDDVEIIVCDNCSSDNTQAVVESFMQKLPVKYYRNPRNLGMDGNFYLCFQRALGEYIMILSDDDILLSDSLRKIRKALTEHRPDYLQLNSGGLVGKKGVKGQVFPFKKDFICEDKETFFDIVNEQIVYISSIVYKKKNLGEISRLKRFTGTFVIGAHAALICMGGEHKKLMLLSHRCVAKRKDNESGYNFYRVWIYEYKRVLLITGIRAGFSREFMERHFIKSINSVIKNMILSLRLNNPTGLTIDQRVILLRYTWKYPSVWLSTYPAAFLPRFILQNHLKRGR